MNPIMFLITTYYFYVPPQGFDKKLNIILEDTVWEILWLLNLENQSLCEYLNGSQYNEEKDWGVGYITPVIFLYYPKTKIKSILMLYPHLGFK